MESAKATNQGSEERKSSRRERESEKKKVQRTSNGRSTKTFELMLAGKHEQPADKGKTQKVARDLPTSP